MTSNRNQQTAASFDPSFGNPADEPDLDFERDAANHMPPTMPKPTVPEYDYAAAASSISYDKRNTIDKHMLALYKLIDLTPDDQQPHALIVDAYQRLCNAGDELNAAYSALIRLAAVADNNLAKL